VVGVIYKMPFKTKNTFSQYPSSNRKAQDAAPNYRDAVIESNVRLSDRCAELEKELNTIKSTFDALLCEERASYQNDIDEASRLRSCALMEVTELQEENAVLKAQLLDGKKESKIELIYDATEEVIPSSWIENKTPLVVPLKKKRVVKRLKKTVEEVVAPKAEPKVEPKAEPKEGCPWEEPKAESKKDAVWMAVARAALADNLLAPVVAPEPAVETKACGVCDEIGWNTMKNTELIEQCTKLGIKGVKKIPKAKIIERLMIHYNGTGDGSGNIVGL